MVSDSPTAQCSWPILKSIPLAAYSFIHCLVCQNRRVQSPNNWFVVLLYKPPTPTLKKNTTWNTDLCHCRTSAIPTFGAPLDGALSLAGTYGGIDWVEWPALAKGFGLNSSFQWDQNLHKKACIPTFDFFRGKVGEYHVITQPAILSTTELVNIKIWLGLCVENEECNHDSVFFNIWNPMEFLPFSWCSSLFIYFPFSFLGLGLPFSSQLSPPETLPPARGRSLEHLFLVFFVNGPSRSFTWFCGVHWVLLCFICVWFVGFMDFRTLWFSWLVLPATPMMSHVSYTTEVPFEVVLKGVFASRYLTPVFAPCATGPFVCPIPSIFIISVQKADPHRTFLIPTELKAITNLHVGILWPMGCCPSSSLCSKLCLFIYGGISVWRHTHLNICILSKNIIHWRCWGTIWNHPSNFVSWIWICPNYPKLKVKK